MDFIDNPKMRNLIKKIFHRFAAPKPDALRVLLEQAPLGVAVVDPTTGVIRSANDHFAKLLAFVAQDVALDQRASFRGVVLAHFAQFVTYELGRRVRAFQCLHPCKPDARDKADAVQHKVAVQVQVAGGALLRQVARV